MTYVAVPLNIEVVHNNPAALSLMMVHSSAEQEFVELHTKIQAQSPQY